MSETNHVKQLLEIDDAALAATYRDLKPRLRGLIAQLIGSGHVATEDLIQETWVHALAGMHSFRGDSSLATWLLRICRNRTYTYLSSQGRRCTGKVDEAASPATDFVLSVELERAVATLNDLERRVLIWHEIKGYTHSEIAAELEIPEGTSRSALSRARRDLRKRLR
jgi:RNA polymerase sigma-70 factor (ECF subfamily)